MLEGGKILKVLERFHAPLDYAINHPSSLPLSSYPYPNKTETKVEPVKMHSDEIDAWNRAFDITGKVLAARKSLVVIDNDIPLTDLERVSFETTMDIATGKIPRPEGSPDTVLYGGKYFRFFPFEFDGMELYIQPHAHLERRADGKALYSASIQLRFLVKDKDGRLAVAVPRPIRHGFPEYYDTISAGAIVSPYEPIDARLSFNTTFNPDISNTLEVEIDTLKRLRMRAELNNKDMGGFFPYDDKVEVFFGQIARFLAPRKDDDTTIDNLFDTKDRAQ